MNVVEMSSFSINLMPKNPKTTKDSIWNTFTCKENNCYLWQTGPLKIWMKRMGQDWLIANENRVEESPRTPQWSLLEEEPLNLSWQRWTFNQVHENIEITPQN